MKLFAPRSPLGNIRLAVEVSCTVGVLAGYIAGKAVYVGADYAVQGIRERARVGKEGI